MDLKKHIRAVPDFPIEGILFRDITPLLHDAAAFQESIDQFVARYSAKNLDAIVGVESRGFLFGAPLALALKIPFVPLRKAGKLPADKIARSYSLEYGEATLELHCDSLNEGDKVVLVDDLLATGGTAKASAQLIEDLKAVVTEIAFVIELDGLGGKDLLSSWSTFSLLNYGLDDK